MIPIDLTLGLALLGVVTGFVAGCAVTTWLLRRRPQRWTDDALCPRRESVEPVVARWTPEHARAK